MDDDNQAFQKIEQEIETQYKEKLQNTSQNHTEKNNYKGILLLREHLKPNLKILIKDDSGFQGVSHRKNGLYFWLLVEDENLKKKVLFSRLNSLVNFKIAKIEEKAPTTDFEINGDRFNAPSYKLIGISETNPYSRQEIGDEYKRLKKILEFMKVNDKSPPKRTKKTYYQQIELLELAEEKIENDLAEDFSIDYEDCYTIYRTRVLEENSKMMFIASSPYSNGLMFEKGVYFEDYQYFRYDLNPHLENFVGFDDFQHFKFGLDPDLDSFKKKYDLPPPIINYKWISVFYNLPRNRSPAQIKGMLEQPIKTGTPIIVDNYFCGYRNKIYINYKSFHIKSLIANKILVTS